MLHDCGLTLVVFFLNRPSEEGANENRAGSSGEDLPTREDPMETSEREKWQKLGQDLQSGLDDGRDTTMDLLVDHMVISEGGKGMEIHGAGLRPLQLPSVATVLNVLKVGSYSQPLFSFSG